MLTLDCITNVFCDGLLTDAENGLMFISLWGRDTAIQELLARLTLPDHEQGIRRFKVEGDRIRQPVCVPDVSVLEKQQARAGKSNLFGELAQIFLYLRTLTKPDLTTRQSWRLFQTDAMSTPFIEPDVWPLIVETCHLPLLNHWRKPVTRAFRQQGWITRLQGYGVGAVGVNLSDDAVETCIEDLIQRGALTLDR